MNRSHVSVWLLATAFLVTARPVSAVTVLPASPVGSVEFPLSEVSGIVGSHSMPDVVWVHNDSGDTARFFGLNIQNNSLGQFTLTGATAIDWEDIAIGPKPGGSYLYLGDIGDNQLVRPQVSIFRVAEPQSLPTTVTAVSYDRVNLVYSDGRQNAESMFVDPQTGDFYVVTKSAVGKVYRAAANIFDNPGQTAALTLLGNLAAPLFEPSAADISPDGRHILVRDRSTTAYLFERAAGQSVWNALQKNGLAVTLAVEAQGEAIGWAADGKGFYTTSELHGAVSQPIFYYGVLVPEPSSCAVAICALFTLAIACRRRRRTSIELDLQR